MGLGHANMQTWRIRTGQSCSRFFENPVKGLCCRGTCPTGGLVPVLCHPHARSARRTPGELRKCARRLRREKAGETFVGVGRALALGARVVHGPGVDVQRNEAVSIGQRFAMRFQNAQGGLMELFIDLARHAVNPLPRDFRGWEALQPRQAPEGHVVPVDAPPPRNRSCPMPAGRSEWCGWQYREWFSARGRTRPEVEQSATGGKKRADRRGWSITGR